MQSKNQSVSNIMYTQTSLISLSFHLNCNYVIDMPDDVILCRDPLSPLWHTRCCGAERNAPGAAHAERRKLISDFMLSLSKWFQEKQAWVKFYQRVEKDKMNRIWVRFEKSNLEFFLTTATERKQNTTAPHCANILNSICVNCWLNIE